MQFYLLAKPVEGLTQCGVGNTAFARLTTTWFGSMLNRNTVQEDGMKDGSCSAQQFCSFRSLPLQPNSASAASTIPEAH
jgi:hypothetical protein